MPDIIVQLSDPHVTVGPGDAAASAALEAVVERVLKLEPLPVAALLTGDLTQNGQPDEYARVREIVARLGIPVHPIPGNHDDRDALRKAFSDHALLRETAGCIDYGLVIGGTRVLMCDTNVPGEEAGALRGETIAWMRDELAREQERPTLIAMHHPPIATGIASIDEIGLPGDDVAALGELLEVAPNVRAVIAGHVHRAIVGALGGCRVSISPSTLFQLELDLGKQQPFRLADEPPGFMIHAVDGGVATSHVKFLGDYKAP